MQLVDKQQEQKDDGTIIFLAKYKNRAKKAYILEAKRNKEFSWRALCEAVLSFFQMSSSICRATCSGFYRRYTC